MQLILRFGDRQIVEARERLAVADANRTDLLKRRAVLKSLRREMPVALVAVEFDAAAALDERGVNDGCCGSARLLDAAARNASAAVDFETALFADRP